MSHRTLRRLAAIAAAAVMILGLAVPAQAQIIERIHYSFTDAYTDTLCGIDVEVETEGRGVFMIRADKQNSTVFFASNNYSFVETVTNPATAKWVVVKRSGNFREIEATPIEGNTYRFRVHETTRVLVEDSSGRTIYRENGLLVFDVLFDTLGDNEPGGDELSFDVVAVRGFPGAVDDICPLFQERIG